MKKQHIPKRYSRPSPQTYVPKNPQPKSMSGITVAKSNKLNLKELRFLNASWQCGFVGRQVMLTCQRPSTILGTSLYIEH